MDNPYEQCVRKEDYRIDRIKYTVWNSVFIIAVVISLFGLLILFTMDDLLTGASIIISSSLLALIAYILKERAIVEYDYSFYDNTLKIARITNNSKRKDMIAINSDVITAIASIKDPKFSGYKNIPGIKILNFVINNKDESYFIYYTQKGSQILVLWEPNYKFLKAIREIKPSVITL